MQVPSGPATVTGELFLHAATVRRDGKAQEAVIREPGDLPDHDPGLRPGTLRWKGGNACLREMMDPQALLVHPAPA